MKSNTMLNFLLGTFVIGFLGILYLNALTTQGLNANLATDNGCSDYDIKLLPFPKFVCYNRPDNATIVVEGERTLNFINESNFYNNAMILGAIFFIGLGICITLFHLIGEVKGEE